MKPNDSDLSPITISECIRSNLDKLFHDFEDEWAKSASDMVLSAVERPMLEVVLEEANMNQTSATQMSGSIRNTIRNSLLPNALRAL